ncbi:amino acid permease [Rhodococcus hoagii]|nr:amino acid permease [Prescottella equi]NKW46241.1 amino acid permease [Prescottella equi]
MACTVSSAVQHSRQDGPTTDKRKLSVVTGLAGLSLDALASVSYGPEAIVLVLALAGGSGLGFTLPVTAAIAGLLAVLVASYRQVIAAFPNGGGAYAVARRRLGNRAALTAAAALIVDYVLNVAVSIAAGVAALTSAFPSLVPYALWIALAVLVAVTALNLRGIADSARAFMIPTVVFVASIFAVIIAGLLRSEPASVLVQEQILFQSQTVGVLLLLKAFSSGCAALTGVEAIANAVPSFRRPRVTNAQRAEVVLGLLLGVMLLGLAVLIEKFSITPAANATVLSQLAAAALGNGVGFFIVQFATVVLLALAANTSYGGLPILMRILADDNALPHRLALRNSKQVYGYGVVTLGVAAGILLISSGGNVNALVPLFAIGVFVGFTLAQAGMVQHWRDVRTPRWGWRAALNGVGAAMTAAAAVVTATMKFADGAWLIVIALPLLVAAMERVRAAYGHISRQLVAASEASAPRRIPTEHATVLVPVSGLSELTRQALSTACEMTTRPLAVHVCSKRWGTVRELQRLWGERYPQVPLVLVEETSPSIGKSLARYIGEHFADRRVVVVIATAAPATRWHRFLPTHRAGEVAHSLRAHSKTAVCQISVPVEPARNTALRA